jgi:hypothetical protein
MSANMRYNLRYSQISIHVTPSLDQQTLMLSALSADRLRHWLQSFADIRPGEGARVALLFVYSMAAVGGVLTIGLAASDVLFMSEMPPSALPYMFILPAAAIIPVLLLYNQVAARLPLTKAIIGSSMLLLAGVVLFRVLLDTAIGNSFALLAALFVFMEFAGTLNHPPVLEHCRPGLQRARG